MRRFWMGVVLFLGGLLGLLGWTIAVVLNDPWAGSVIERLAAQPADLAVALVFLMLAAAGLTIVIGEGKDNG